MAEKSAGKPREHWTELLEQLSAEWPGWHPTTGEPFTVGWVREDVEPGQRNEPINPTTTGRFQTEAGAWAAGEWFGGEWRWSEVDGAAELLEEAHRQAFYTTATGEHLTEIAHRHWLVDRADGETDASVRQRCADALETLKYGRDAPPTGGATLLGIEGVDGEPDTVIDLAELPAEVIDQLGGEGAAGACPCGHKMQMVFVYDNAQNADPEHAYNLYACPGCGLICKEDVWTDAGLRWLKLDGKLVVQP